MPLTLEWPNVNVGARLLKQVHPGGIITSADVVAALRDDAPDLAKTFNLSDRAFEVPRGDGLSVETHQARDSSEDAWGAGPSEPRHYRDEPNELTYELKTRISRVVDRLSLGP
jgi:hypothetical protein